MKIANVGCNLGLFSAYFTSLVHLINLVYYILLYIQYIQTFTILPKIYLAAFHYDDVRNTYTNEDILLHFKRF